MLPGGSVSPGQQQEKAGWWCCAGVRGLIGHLGDGLKARPGPLVLMEKELHICLKNPVSFLSCTDARVAVLHWVRSHCELGCAEASAPAGGLLCDCSHQHLSSASCLTF